MKYPQNADEAKKAMDEYYNLHYDGMTPTLSISIEKNIPIDMDGEVYAADIEFYVEKDGYCDSCILVKSIYIIYGEFAEEVNPLDYLIIPLKDFIAAADAIKAYTSIIKQKVGEK